ARQQRFDEPVAEPDPVADRGQAPRVGEAARQAGSQLARRGVDDVLAAVLDGDAAREQAGGKRCSELVCPPERAKIEDRQRGTPSPKRNETRAAAAAPLVRGDRYAAATKKKATIGSVVIPDSPPLRRGPSQGSRE